MRHGKADKKLNRSYSFRKATLRDIARSVILHQSVKTTTAKAKESKKLIDKLISLGKRGDLHSRRKAIKKLHDRYLVGVLFNKIAPRFSTINGGYTRILPWLNRKGDNATLAILELTIKQVEERVKKVTPEEKPKAISKEKAELKEVKKEEPIEKKGIPPVKEKPKKKEIQPVREKHPPKEKQPPKKFFKGLRNLFKRERDSL